MGGGSALAGTVSAIAIGGVPLADCAIADFPLGATALTSCPPQRPLSRASGGGTGWGVMAGVRWGRRKTPSRWFHPHPRLPPSRGKEFGHGGATVRPTRKSDELHFSAFWQKWGETGSVNTLLPSTMLVSSASELKLRFSACCPIHFTSLSVILLFSASTSSKRWRRSVSAWSAPREKRCSAWIAEAVPPTSTASGRMRCVYR